MARLIVLRFLAVFGSATCHQPKPTDHGERDREDGIPVVRDKHSAGKEQGQRHKADDIDAPWCPEVAHGAAQTVRRPREYPINPTITVTAPKMTSIEPPMRITS